MLDTHISDTAKTLHETSNLTLAQRIIGKASGLDGEAEVSVGNIVTCKVDLAMMHDSGGPRRVEPVLQHLNAGLFDPDKVVLVADHYVPADEPESRAILELTRQWAIQRQVTFYDGEGICHVVLPERGHLAPGMLVVGGDSHSPTGGAFGSYMFGIGSTEMAAVLATGEIWLQIPQTILLNWNGVLPERVTAKDMMLAMCGRLGMSGGRYQAVEYVGSTIGTLGMQERMTLCNMAAELGAQAGLIAPDNRTMEFITKARRHNRQTQNLVGSALMDDKRANADSLSTRSTWHSTPLQLADECHDFDASTLSPQVAAPHSPANAVAVNEIERQSVDVAYIGACTGAKYTDLAMAAEVLAGQTVNNKVQLIIAPASRQDQERAEQEGLMSVFEDAGARILPTACGICAGYGSERLGADINCISSTARNFKGRMGESSSRVWLASPYTVAASAVAGYISDPRMHGDGAG